MDRPGFTACVFHLKKQELLQLVKEKKVLGRFCADVYIIEYQKQSLPHMYLLLFFHSDDQIFDTAKIDKNIFTELPTEEDGTIGELFGIVSLVMLHSLYGNQSPNASCMKRFNHSSPQYTKWYPCKFLSETDFKKNCYPLYCC